MRTWLPGVFTLFLSLAFPAQNLIQNGDFEDGPDSTSFAWLYWADNETCTNSSPMGPPDHWLPYADMGPTRIVRNTSTCFSTFNGPRSGDAWIYVGSMTRGKNILASPLQTGAMYRISFYAFRITGPQEQRPGRLELSFNKSGSVVFTPVCIQTNWTHFDTIFISRGPSTELEISSFDHFYSDPSAYAGLALDSISLVMISPANVAEQALMKISVRPQPAESIAYFDGPMPGSTVQIMDLAGRELLITSVEPDKGVDLSDLTPGIFLYRVSDAKGRVWNGKLVRQ